MNKRLQACASRGLAGLVATASLVLVLVSPHGTATANTGPTPNQPIPAANALTDAIAGEIPEEIARALPNARLAGEGLLRWFGFRIYQARLFVGDGYDHASPAQGPVALDLTYKRSFDGQSIAERSADEIESLGIGTREQRTRWAARMAALFPDVREGDRLTGILTASGRTLFVHNDRPTGYIDDPAFGPAFFSIWLDERTSVPALRAQLIGKTEPPATQYESAQ